MSDRSSENDTSADDGPTIQETLPIAPLDPRDPRLSALAHLQIPVWIFDVDGQRFIWANEAGVDFWKADDLASLCARDLTDTSASVQRNLERTRDDCARSGRSVAEHWTLYPRDTPRSVETVLSPFTLEDGRVALLAHIVDHTRDSSSDTLHSAQALLHMATMVTLHDEHWRLMYANPAARAASPDGRVALPEILQNADDLDTIKRRLERDGECDIDARVMLGRGAWLAMNVRQSRDPINGKKSYLVSAVDVTAQRNAEAHVRRLAYHDSLTKLNNRAALLHHLESRIAGGSLFDILYLDLNRFKRINESLGYSIGDELLVLTARRFERIAGGANFVSRLGNNEFVIVTQRLSPGSSDGTSLARRILDAMTEPLHVGSHKVSIQPSIGICRHPEHGTTPVDLLRFADTAMNVAKRDKLGSCVFDAEMDREIRDRLALENDLARALRADELELHYQPRVSSTDSSVVAFEALVRWRHPERGLLGPHVFIALAEETGMIGELGDQVMSKAMHQQSIWARAGYHVGVSINVSPKQFGTQRLASIVRENISLSECEASMIELEITESALFDDTEAVSKALIGIRNQGVRVAIDDFGTGYSNLARLGTYPLDALKIDRAFVSDRSQSTLLEAIVAMGQALGLDIVAEGIETDEQAVLMRQRGCHELQGYLYSRPLAVTDATSYLEHHGRRHSDPLH